MSTIIILELVETSLLYNSKSYHLPWFVNRVQHLSLRYNGITDVGAEQLAKALGTAQMQNMKLLSLNLNGNKITDKGVQFFATVSHNIEILWMFLICNPDSLLNVYCTLILFK